jgi:hypothetical protein
VSSSRASLSGLSCPSPSFCLAVDGAGRAVTTTRPTAGASAWSTSTINPGLTIGGVSCPSPHFCAAMGSGDFVATSSNPAGGSQAWKLKNLRLSSYNPDLDSYQSDILTSISCASRSLCVATRYSAASTNLEVSRNPGAGGASTWVAEAVGQPNYDFFDDVSCPSTRLCVAAGAQGGTVAVSTDDGGGFQLTRVEPPRYRNSSGLIPSLDGVSCPTRSFCAAVDVSGGVITTNRPAGGSRAWSRRTQIDLGRSLWAVSCASKSLCAVIDLHGRVLVSDDPTGGARTWKVTRIDRTKALSNSFSGVLTGISCSSTRLCVASDQVGNVIVGARRAHPQH